MLQFSKESVPAVHQPTASLLSSTLASRRATSAVASGEPPGGATERSAECGVTSIRPSSRAYTVGHVIDSIVRNLVGVTELGLKDDPTSYDLRIADDDGGVDGDFPPIDGIVAITGVGADSFVLCESANDAAVLLVNVPVTAESAERDTQDDAALAALDITCRSARDVAAGADVTPYVVRLSYT